MYEPIQMKRSMKYGSNYWESYSPKVKRTVRFFSDLEYDHWILVETNSDIEYFCEQPLKIEYYLNGVKSESIIDMWVKYKNGEEAYFEIKYTSELDKNNPKSARTIKQVATQKSWCEEKGYKYAVMTELDIRSNEIYLDNLRRILSFAKNIDVPNELDNLRIIELINNGVNSLCDIQTNFSGISASRVRETISFLIYKGKIGANIDKVLFGNKTEVWLKDE